MAWRGIRMRPARWCREHSHCRRRGLNRCMTRGQVVYGGRAEHLKSGPWSLRVLLICRVVNEKPVQLRRRRLKRWLRRALIIVAAPPVLLFTVFYAVVAVWPYPADIER